MKINVVMPQLGESIAEGEVIRWLKRPGEAVERDEALVEVKTDKATVEVPSPAGGTLSEIAAKEGDVVEVGRPIAAIETTSDRAATSVEHPASAARVSARTVEAKRPAPPVPRPPKEPQAAQAAVSEALAQPTAALRRAVPSPGPEAAEPACRDGGAGREAEGARMTPLARRLVREHGLDPASIEGTGAGGRITGEDVLKALERGKEAGPSASPAEESPKEEAPPLGEEEEAAPLSAMRRRIAARLVHSKQTIPHVTTVVECDMTAIGELRRKHKAAWEAEGLKLTYMPFIMKATVDALGAFPPINASWGGDKLILHRRVHLAVAVAVEGGLAVPVIRNAEGLGVKHLARRLTEVAEHARAGKLTADEVSGSTFTITNPGMFGAVFSTPIINPPNAAILGIGRIAETPVVREGRIVARYMGHLCLSYDHRIVDGETAIRFLQHMRGALEAGRFEVG